jgi:hypothetical protein
MQEILKQETKPPQGSPPELVIRKWLVVFGTLFNREITPFLIGSWCELLSGLSVPQIEQGCKQIAKTWTFSHFPTPGAVLTQFEKANEKGLELESETEWENLLDWTDKNYFPDTGIRKGARQLSATTQHAARAAGGFRWIATCPESELIWCRRTFVAAYKNVHETGQLEHLLGNGEAKRILAGFSERLALPVADADWEKKYTPPATPQNPPKSAVVKAPAEPFRLPTEKEREQRKQEQRAKISEWVATHPEIESK